MLIITITLYAIIIFYVMLILYFLSGWLQLKEYLPSDKTSTTRVSVLIPVRNEEKNIRNLLDDLREQRYPQTLFEVLVIDDYSADRTAEIVKNCGYSNVRLLSLKEIFPDKAGRANKKAGIEKAVEAATGELIITTDADCRIGSNWMKTIVQYYDDHHPVMIAGMVNYFHDTTFLGKFQTLDFLSLVGIAAASIQNGFYNLCNGANLAYTREAFLAVNGFEDIDHIPSGDDMMLMHKLAKKYPGRIAYLKNKDAIVLTHTEKDFNAFWHQRVRWTSKSTHYEDKRITAILVFAYLFNLLIVVNFVAGLFVPFLLRISMQMFVVKLLIDTIFTYAVAKFFRRENLLWLFLPMQITHILYILLIAPAGVFGKYNWKGRKV